MGCFASKSADSKASRLSRWRATGIVALRDGKLKSFPDEVLELGKSVRTLDLTQNKLVDVPEEISKLMSIQRLILANNVIERLPMNIGKLQSIKFIILDGNRLTTFPDEEFETAEEQYRATIGLLTYLPLHGASTYTINVVASIHGSFCGELRTQSFVEGLKPSEYGQNRVDN